MDFGDHKHSQNYDFKVTVGSTKVGCKLHLRQSYGALKIESLEQRGNRLDWMCCLHLLDLSTTWFIACKTQLNVLTPSFRWLRCRS